MTLTRSDLSALEHWSSMNYDLPLQVDFGNPGHMVALGKALDRFISVMPELLKVYSKALDTPPPVEATPDEVVAALVAACTTLEELGTVFEESQPAGLVGPEDQPQPLLAKRLGDWQRFAKRFEKQIQQYPTREWDDLIERLGT